ncbi:unnamed protein product, partial [Candidula unifasciata]
KALLVLMLYYDYANPCQKMSPENCHSSIRLQQTTFFSGLPLASSLPSKGLHYTGTVRPNRIPGAKLKMEKEMKNSGRGVVDHSVERSSNIVAVR